MMSEWVDMQEHRDNRREMKKQMVSCRYRNENKQWRLLKLEENIAWTGLASI